MFGCRTLIRFHKTGQTKDKDLVDVYQLGTIRQRHGLSQEGILLFALPVDNNFDESGLLGCGKRLALTLTKQQDLVTNLASIGDERELSRWRAQLTMAIRKIQTNFILKVFQQFPWLKVFKACKSPTVSADDRLRAPNFPRGGWFRSFGRDPTIMVQLYRFLLTHFYSTKSCNWPAELHVPMELNTRLRETPCTHRANSQLNIQLKPKRKLRPTTTLRIEDPLLVLPELAHAFEIPEISESLAFEPIKLDLLACVLRHGLPETVFVGEDCRTTPGTKKRKPNPTKQDKARGGSTSCVVQKHKHKLSSHDETALVTKKRKSAIVEGDENEGSSSDLKAESSPVKLR